MPIRWQVRERVTEGESGVVLRTEYADEFSQPLKTVDMSDLKLLDPQNRCWLAMRIQARNQQSGHQTELSFRNMS